MTHSVEISDAEAIAAKLTEAQRRVVSQLNGGFGSPAMRNLTWRTVASAGRYLPALIEREWQDGCAQCTYYRLTPLGLAVRAYLLERQS